MICLFEIKVMKGSWKKLSTAMFLMDIIERSAIIVNITHLLGSGWTPQKSIGLYNVVNNLLVFPALNKIIRHKNIV